MGTVISALYYGGFAVVVAGMLAHFIVYGGLTRRRVPFSALWSGMPGYLRRVCEQLPPSKENVRLAQIAKWSDILVILGFVAVVIAGPVFSQVPK
jgi:hypothetical protein